MIFFVNSGITLEFGDEILCTTFSAIGKESYEGLFSSRIFKNCRTQARNKIAYIEQNHPWAGLIGAIFGYVFFAPLTIFFARELKAQNTPKGVFETVFKVEIIESVVCIVGQLFTDGKLEPAMFSLVLGGFSGIVRGGFQGLKLKFKIEPDFKYTVAIWIIASISAIVYLANLN